MMPGMIDRMMVAENILNRLDNLEAQMRDVLNDALTPQASVPDQPTWVGVSGWVATGTTLRDVNGYIVMDATIPSITLAAGGHFKSADYVAGASGFDVNGGVAEFNNVTVRGTIIATTGAIGGWTIGVDNLSGGNITLNSSGYMMMGTGNDVVGLSASDATYRLWIGHTGPASAPFRVTKVGGLYATGATISGTITATLGNIGGWTIGATSLVAGSGATTVGLDSGGTNPAFYAGSATPGSAPFRVTQAGVLFAQGATIQSGASGARVVLDGTGIKGYDATTQRYQISNDGSGWLGNSSIFSWTAAGVVTLNGSAVMPNTILGGKVNFFNVPILDGLVLTNNSPSAGKVAWNAFTLTYQGVSYAVYDADTSNKWIYWNKNISTTALQTSATPPVSANDQFIIAVNTSGTASHEIFANIIYADYISVVNLAAVSANMGALHVDGVLDVGASGGIYQGTGTFAAPTTGLKIWNDGGIGRIAGYNATVLQSYFGADGVLYAAAGSVWLGAGGLALAQGSSIGNKVKWYNSTTAIASIYGYHQAAPAIVEWLYTAVGDNSDNGDSSIAQWDVAGKTGAGVSLNTRFSIVADATGGEYVLIEGTAAGADLKLNGGISVGNTASVPNDGDVWTVNDIRVGGGLYVGSLGTDPGDNNLVVDGVAQSYHSHKISVTGAGWTTVLTVTFNTAGWQSVGVKVLASDGNTATSGQILYSLRGTNDAGNPPAVLATTVTGTDLTGDFQWVVSGVTHTAILQAKCAASYYLMALVDIISAGSASATWVWA